MTKKGKYVTFLKKSRFIYVTNANRHWWGWKN